METGNMAGRIPAALRLVLQAVKAEAVHGRTRPSCRQACTARCCTPPLQWWWLLTCRGCRRRMSLPCASRTRLGSFAAPAGRQAARQAGKGQDVEGPQYCAPTAPACRRCLACSRNAGLCLRPSSVCTMKGMLTAPGACPLLNSSGVLHRGGGRRRQRRWPNSSVVPAARKTALRHAISQLYTLGGLRRPGFLQSQQAIAAPIRLTSRPAAHSRTWRPGILQTRHPPTRNVAPAPPCWPNNGALCR